MIPRGLLQQSPPPGQRHRYDFSQNGVNRSRCAMRGLHCESSNYNAEGREPLGFIWAIGVQVERNS